MAIDTLLFLLRIVSVACLMVFLAFLFWAIWRDYRTAAAHTEIRRRSHGQLIGLASADTGYIETGTNFALLPITSIGRAPTNTIVINETVASSDHAIIVLRGGQWWLEDRNSRNGTLLNGERITSATIITEGDIVGIGSHSFKLHLE